MTHLGLLLVGLLRLGADALATDECESMTDNSALLQVKSDRREPFSVMRSNAELWATYSGLDFILSQSNDFVARKIVEKPLMTHQAVGAFGITLEMSDLIATSVPTVRFVNPVWTEAGVKVNIELTDLEAKAYLNVSSPEAFGQLSVKAAGLFEGSFNIAVVDKHIKVGVSSLVAPDLHLQPTLDVSCVNPGFWSSVPCAIISHLSGHVPSWLVDTILYFTQSHVEEILEQVIDEKLDADLHALPSRLQVVSSDHANVQFAFRPLGMFQSDDLKAASYQVLAEEVPRAEEAFPVPGLILQNHSTSTMFAMAFSRSVPNSLFAILHDSGTLTHTFYPEDVPDSSPLGLDTFSLELAFYCPWLATIYALECPLWSPCPVSATIQTSGRPFVELSHGVNLSIPLSVDFRLLIDNSSESTFLWRVNTTASGILQPSMTHNGPCDQLLKARLTELHATWFDVTKSMDDSWVATALSINLFLPMLLNGPLLDKINAHFDEGIRLKPIHFGGSQYALSNSFVEASSGRIVLSSDVWLPEKCPS